MAAAARLQQRWVSLMNDSGPERHEPVLRDKRRGPSCPVCGKPAATGQATGQATGHEPFCSPRCADVDLNRWLSGVYVIPGRPLGEEDAD